MKITTKCKIEKQKVKEGLKNLISPLFDEIENNSKRNRNQQASRKAAYTDGDAFSYMWEIMLIKNASGFNQLENDVFDLASVLNLIMEEVVSYMKFHYKEEILGIVYSVDFINIDLCTVEIIVSYKS